MTAIPNPEPRTAPMRPRPHRACELRGATVRFADRTVLTDIDLVVGPKDRIVLIGDNGAGKTTLLRAIAGQVPLASGERRVELPGGIAIAAQQPEFAPGATVAEALDELLHDFRDMEGEMQTASEALAAAPAGEQSGLLGRLGDLTDRFEARGGYDIERRVEAALDRLSLGGLDRGRPVADLSGGERARLALGAALSAEAELLLLDEPTNDLDDAAVVWLEEMIARHRGACVIVSHDRALLEQFAIDIVHLEGGRAARYGDGYAGYLRARAAERRRLIAEYEAWRAELARSTELVEANAFRLRAIPRKMERAVFGHGAFRARGRDHGAVSRIRQAKERVERLQADPAVRPADPLRFTAAVLGADGDARTRANASAVDRAAPEARMAAEPLLVARSVRLGPPGPRLSLAELDVHEGDRWIVSGPNGAGKTTLLRVLAGDTPVEGGLDRRPGLRIARLKQEMMPVPEGSAVARLGLLDAYAAALGAYQDDAAETLLAFGLFRPADLEVPLHGLSIGQRRRLELAIALSAPSELLLLDEPTNHLAPELVDQLEEALVDYPGAVITVTHDRRWRERAPRGGRLEVRPGGAVVRVSEVRAGHSGSSG
ncbi:ATP-binding cassette domain-containing protein [Leucobacter sp. gxy201]|uniref:ABC-F family ATP-binding cassette domain-containing protein n=1 Tax=Leucobacter sp. gxy201 TaxID=2957200 RepID=UPI003DA186EE